MKILLSALVVLYIACGHIATKTTDVVGEDSQSPEKALEKDVRYSKNGDDCVPINFHFLVAKNELFSPESRYIEIFLEERAFDETNLRTLFTKVSNWYPEPVRLTVAVKTNWAQLPLPVSPNCPGMGTSGNKTPESYNYHEATFYRRHRDQKQEYFRYNPVLKTSDFRTVILKDK